MISIYRTFQHLAPVGFGGQRIPQIFYFALAAAAKPPQPVREHGFWRANALQTSLETPTAQVLPSNDMDPWINADKWLISALIRIRQHSATRSRLSYSSTTFTTRPGTTTTRRTARS